MSQIGKIILAVIVTAIIAGGGFYYWQQKQAPSLNSINPDDEAAKTAENSCEQSGGTFTDNKCECLSEDQSGQTAEMTYNPNTAACQTITDSPDKISTDNSTDAPENTEQAVGMANPASVNCVQKGGRLEIRKNKLGEYGVCLFEDNRQCEEWALFRGECPVGGKKITGYETDAEIYCAITGGEVENLGTRTPMCKRIDGTYCSTQANMDGDCPDPHDPNPNAGNVEAP